MQGLAPGAPKESNQAMIEAPCPAPLSLRHPWSWSVVVAGLVAAAALWGSEANLALFLTINHAFSGTFWAGLTIFGDTVVALALLLPLCWRRPDIVRAVAISAIFAALLTHGIKVLAAMPRPAAVLEAELIRITGPLLTRSSFPSGHTTTIFTLTGVICLLNPAARWRYGLLIFATLVGLSRAGVGAHWPVDIAAGMALGWLCALLGVHLGRHWRGGLSLTARRIYALLFGGCAIALLAGYNTHYGVAEPLQYLVAIATLVLTAPDLRYLFGGDKST